MTCCRRRCAAQRAQISAFGHSDQMPLDVVRDDGHKNTERTTTAGIHGVNSTKPQYRHAANPLASSDTAKRSWAREVKPLLVGHPPPIGGRRELTGPAARWGLATCSGDGNLTGTGLRSHARRCRGAAIRAAGPRCARTDTARLPRRGRDALAITLGDRGAGPGLQGRTLDSGAVVPDAAELLHARARRPRAVDAVRRREGWGCATVFPGRIGRDIALLLRRAVQPHGKIGTNEVRGGGGPPREPRPHAMHIPVNSGCA
ncbi:hypothetical protein B0H17DRAFT_1136499 [Mycena rosella]|uniref:Uncharacterized protein n=1 Tax=Mycena rosella TaxID=1033263 RepID=A0AAD7DDR3_MYCRO|nr:hypothetical protein B0H17DRAFT_1136499 [Mycena rosella]